MIKIREKIVAEVASALPGLRTCRSYGGRFDLAELKAIAARCPAALVACLRVPQLRDDGDGRQLVRIRWALYLVTRDAPQLPRDEAALHLVNWLLLWLPCQRWGGPAGRPESIAADNLFSREIDGVGVALWAISWEQEHRLGESAFESIPEWLPTELYSAFAPDVGAAEYYTRLWPEEEAP